MTQRPTKKASVLQPIEEVDSYTTTSKHSQNQPVHYEQPMPTIKRLNSLMPDNVAGANLRTPKNANTPKSRQHTDHSETAQNREKEKKRSVHFEAQKPMIIMNIAAGQGVICELPI